MKKVVLAYSGGLDTSVAVAWLREQFGVEVVTLTVDVGGGSLRPGVERRAMSAGAARAYVVDARERFVTDFVWPHLQAGALYQGVYPLATALARPLIAQLLVEVANREGADAVAHGCTGKGNDQVRFDVAVHALDPGLEVVAPMRVGMGLSREQSIDYAHARGIEIPITKSSPYSIDVNLWGRSIETGVLEQGRATIRFGYRVLGEDGTRCALGYTEHCVVTPDAKPVRPPAALAAPLAGRLFFAGEATDTVGDPGTVHGAMTTGARAAAEIVTALRG